ncbi:MULTISPECIES: hypothetical protein [Methylosinus]|uniref:Methyltransferase n=1 Tax=Methylosinus trichosporium (strain ATCC 35070 / NCIMB 11131 / UNIQEM 75 / OB3b) TaxID=595536 RepID=A0A2D2CYH6_METT3|nr:MULTISPECIES: hypothetical protein [Methylosinus]ATQ67801.1 methyltransferase [Methylosinus trichosporium OB3b]OBS51824.1 hypothetical protein A8B73_14295 [Methylosinus sp. 3S-1]
MSGQNRSTAVMQRRAKTKEPRPDDSFDAFDYYPTPAWGTRALCEWLEAEGLASPGLQDVWEPACGEGHMAKPLGEFFREVYAADVCARGFGDVDDFLWHSDRRADWIITNPPFRLASQFATTAFDRARFGVAMLVRIAFLEGSDRYNNLFAKLPPSHIVQFAERLPMVKGWVDRNASSATAYTWVVWHKASGSSTRFHWLAPCRKRLERDSDYASSAGKFDASQLSAGEPAA